MNIQEQLPELLNMQQACEVLGMSRKMIATHVAQGKLTEHMGEITTASAGEFLMDVRGWEQEYTELFIYQSIQP